MTQLAYITREDWAQHGTAMAQSSSRIREWLGPEPYLFAVTDIKKFSHRDRGADVEVAEYISGTTSPEHVVSITELRRLLKTEPLAHAAVVAVHPFGDPDCEVLREVVEANVLGRLFVMLWAPSDMARHWLDGLGATNLHSGEAHSADPLLVKAAVSWVAREYNGLSSGRGKDAVVQILKAFQADGYSLNDSTWLSAFFAAGGSFRHAESVAKLLREVQKGTKHRVNPAFRPDIVSVLRDQLAEDNATS